MPRIENRLDVRWKPPAWLVAVGIIVAACAVTTAWVDVRVEYDKKFDFKPMRTWGWKPDGAGQVMMARTADDNPDAMRKRAEPIIVDAVTTEIKKTGLEPATGAPDLFVTYYLLLTIGENAQTVGQFLPSVADWGVPWFPPATQSLTVMNQGSLVLDLTSKETIVWRGLARAKLTLDAEDKKRESALREAVRDLLRKYPKK
jgi:hypothetical protein